MKKHVQPKVSIIEASIPLFTPSQEDIDNRIYIEPKGGKFSILNLLGEKKN